MKSAHLLQHVNTLPNGEEDVKVIGLYSSRDEAISAIQRLSKEKGFRDSAKIIDPLKDDETDGFCIDEYEINKDHWVEGFV